MGLPNQLSIFRIVLTPLFVLLFLSENIILRYVSLGVFTIAVLTDWYDGYIARKYNNVSTGGKFLDPLADKILVITS
ncbi:MAG: CDP-alcohol phosphatidyltransferase family protein, partial [bacterium]